MRKLWAEFKKFISRGSVIDLAVGMVIGSAFTKIVNSLVNDLLMPLIALAIGKTHLNELVWIVKKTPVLDANGAQVFVDGVAQYNQITINYGNFLQVIIDFFLIALTLFLVLKTFNSLKDHAIKSKKRIKELADKLDKDEELSEKESRWFRKQSKKIAKKAAAEEAEQAAAAEAKAAEEAAKAAAAVPPAAPELSTTDKLLTEILELLKKQEVSEAAEQPKAE